MSTVRDWMARGCVTLAVVFGLLAVVTAPGRDAAAEIPPLPRLCIPQDCNNQFACGVPGFCFFGTCNNKPGGVCIQCRCDDNIFTGDCECY
jgi:hypothetical protein